MALRVVMLKKVPMVIILGATGTGKTKLGVELAQKYGTEIISADSMQIYKGLDVVTAKATPHERAAAPHHLLDILEPHQVFTVVDFRNRALNIINNLTEQGKMPIVVGGTNYYIESIVYKILVEDMDDKEALLWDKSRRKRNLEEIDWNEDETVKKLATEDQDITETPTTSKASNETSATEATSRTDVLTNKEEMQKFVDTENKFTNEEIHEKLKQIDPAMAARLHVNNRRKVLRAIEVWLKTGRRHSDILAEQKLSEGQLRRPGATIMFWLKCDQRVHDDRLDARVGRMVQEGLVAELLDFHERHNLHRVQDGRPPDYTKGIFQTLGFKEFHEYLMLSEEQRATDEGKALLQQSIENMKMATRRYARRQNKMIRGRFLEHPTREVPLVYELDTTDVSKWDDMVKNKATHIIDSFLNGTTCQFEPIKSEIDDEKKKIDGNSYNFCNVCQRVFLGDNVYAIHMKSIRHKKVMKKKKLLEDKCKKEHNLTDCSE